jgi:hypothetical protein
MPSCGKSVWIVSWTADCLFEKVAAELLCYFTSPTSQSFLCVGGATPDISIDLVMT